METVDLSKAWEGGAGACPPVREATVPCADCSLPVRHQDGTELVKLNRPPRERALLTDAAGRYLPGLQGNHFTMHPSRWDLVMTKVRVERCDRTEDGKKPQITTNYRRMNGSDRDGTDERETRI